MKLLVLPAMTALWALVVAATDPETLPHIVAIVVLSGTVVCMFIVILYQTRMIGTLTRQSTEAQTLCMEGIKTETEIMHRLDTQVMYLSQNLKDIEKYLKAIHGEKEDGRAA